MENMPVILASGSSARKALLNRVGLPFETAGHHVDEREISASLPVQEGDPAGLALALSRAKALDVSGRNPGRLVIGSDQVCACGGTIFHKPATRKQAMADLQAMRGKTHQLFSAAVAARDGKVVFEACEHADMTLRNFSDSFAEHYLDMAGEDVLWCCGVYQVERHALLLFERVEGREDVIMGMPMLPLLAFLRREGILEE